MATDHEAGRYEPLRETHRRVAEEEEKKRLAINPEQAPSAQPEQEHSAEENSPEARYAAYEEEMMEKVRLGKIGASEMIYLLRRFDNQLVAESVVEEAQRARDPDEPAGLSRLGETSGLPISERSVEPELGVPEPAQAGEVDRDPATRQARIIQSPGLPQTSVERSAETAAYEITHRGEMTEARAARLARLQDAENAIGHERARDTGREGRERSSDDRSR